MSQTRDDDLSITGPVPARTCPSGWLPASWPRVVGNAPAFVDELRGSGGGGGASVARYYDASPGAYLGAQYF